MGMGEQDNMPVEFDADYRNDLAKALGVTAEIAETPPRTIRWFYMTGGPVSALHDWMATARIEAGSLFRDRSLGHGRTPGSRSKSINDILKHRAQLAGLDPAEFSAHGLRSGYLTEAANRGVPLPEAMEQSRHRSVQQASSYYNSATRKTGRAARLL